jgi:hypothetical protein
MNSVIYIIGLILLLAAAAIFVPTNNLTGNVIKEGPCGEYGCSELCDTDAQESACSSGTVCCPTHWASGVCDYSVNCEKIREYSLYQTIEQYQDSVREKPTPVQADWQRFFLPLILTAGIIIYFILQRKQER